MRTTGFAALDRVAVASTAPPAEARLREAPAGAERPSASDRLRD